MSLLLVGFISCIYGVGIHKIIQFLWFSKFWYSAKVFKRNFNFTFLNFSIVKFKKTLNKIKIWMNSLQVYHQIFFTWIFNFRNVWNKLGYWKTVMSLHLIFTWIFYLGIHNILNKINHWKHFKCDLGCLILYQFLTK